jgi:hypothetical protein
MHVVQLNPLSPCLLANEHVQYSIYTLAYTTFLSSDVLLHPCLHHVIVMNSEAAACMMSQHLCTADHNIPSLH